MKRVAATTGALAGLAALAFFLSPAGATSDALACGSGTHGSAGYAYAGLQSKRVGSGVRATITALRPPAVAAGHAAGWIGIGGPGAGPNGPLLPGAEPFDRFQTPKRLTAALRAVAASASGSHAARR